MPPVRPARTVARAAATAFPRSACPHPRIDNQIGKHGPIESAIDPTAIVLDFPWKGGSIPLLKLQEEAITMGDKSPKAKDKFRKQDTADKNQKALAAKAKMSSSPVFPGNKTK